MINSYTVTDDRMIGTNVRFIRIKPVDLAVTLKDILDSLSNLSWISKFDEDYIRESYSVRANATVDYIKKEVITESESAVTSNSG